MKKLFKIFSLVLFMLIIMPNNTYAAISFGEPDSDGWHISTGSDSAGRYGSFAAGDVKWRYTDEENGIKEWQFTLTPSGNFQTIYMTLVPNALEIQKVTAGSDFKQLSFDNSAEVVIQPKSSLTKNKKVLLFTVTTKDTAETGCMLSYSPGSTSCAKIGDIYLDKDGKSVTKSEYEKACGTGGTTTVTDPKDPDIPNTPDTGSVIPYFAIGGGLAAIAGVYLYSRKSSKVYKI